MASAGAGSLLGGFVTSPSEERGAIAFAEKLLGLLEEGRYTATYKYAVLLALLDLCLEQTSKTGAPPRVLTTRQLAEKILDLYWPHTLPFLRGASASVLRQNLRGQAEILSAISRFRERYARDPSAPLWAARMAAPHRLELLVRFIEWKLIEMPLPRLQIMGNTPHPFICEIPWDQAVRQGDVRRYQEKKAGPFDNRILLKPQVGEYLLQLNGLLRPLIQRKWAALVARLNGHEEDRLEEFLFGAERIATAKLRVPLWKLQDGRCFYCERRIGELDRAELDHFIPWARYPDDGIENLVVADSACNGEKRAFLAAAQHVVRWSSRFAVRSPIGAELADVAEHTGWERHPDQTLSVARAIYLRLPHDAKLWLHGRKFVVADRSALGRALGAA